MGGTAASARRNHRGTDTGGKGREEQRDNRNPSALEQRDNPRAGFVEQQLSDH